MPLVTVYLYPGRTADQKRALVRGVTDVLVREAGVSAESVEVMLFDVPREHWGFGGSLPEPKPATAPASQQADQAAT